VKSGTPYISHQKASHWKSNFKKERKGILWQEENIPFFENVEFSESTDSVVTCYLELADKVESELTNLDDDYFNELAEAMRIWGKLWE
jgi:hypothetical protein